MEPVYVPRIYIYIFVWEQNVTKHEEVETCLYVNHFEFNVFPA